MTEGAGTTTPADAGGGVGSAIAVAAVASGAAAFYGALATLRLQSPAGAWAPPGGSAETVLAGIRLAVLAVGVVMLLTARKSRHRGDAMGLRATLFNTVAKGAGFLLLAAASWHTVGWPGAAAAAGVRTAAAGAMLSTHAIAAVVIGALAMVGPMATSRRAPDPRRLADAGRLWMAATAMAVVDFGVVHLAW